MEVEKRTFISKEKYEQLMQFFVSKNIKMTKVNQVIYKYHSDLDFRLIFTRDEAMFRLRGMPNTDGEMVIPIDPNQVGAFVIMLRSLGMHVDVKWYRVRTKFQYGVYSVTMDETYKYGHVISIAVDTTMEEQDQAYAKLDQLFETLQIPITTKEQFNDRYRHYNTEWVDFTADFDEEAFINRISFQ